MMNEEACKQLFENSSLGYACHRIVLDETGTPCNCEFTSVNGVFEKLVGRKAVDIVGKAITEVLPEIGQRTREYIVWYGEVSLQRSTKEFEWYSEPLDRWCRVSAFSPGEGYVVAVYTDITGERRHIDDLHKLTEMSEEILQGMQEDEEYQWITDTVWEISGAKYAAFNLYDEDGKHFTTMAIAGDRGKVERAMRMVGTQLDKKKWSHDSVRAEKIKDRMVTRFPALHDLAGDVVPREICELLSKTFGVGETVLVKIPRGDTMLGDFTLFMPSGKEFTKDETVLIAARQFGIGLSRTRAEDALRRVLDEYDTVFQGTQDAMFLVDVVDEETFRFIRNNQAHAKATGITLEMIEGKTPQELLGRELGDTVAGNYSRCVGASRPISYEETLDLPGGRRTWQTTLTPVFYEGRIQHLVGSCHDITERKEAEDQLRYLSFHDSLTGLYNRHFLEEEMKRLDTARQLPISVIMGDINGLKLVNDTYGHDTGDGMIRKVAAILKGACREEDILVRWGGDEFLILLPQTRAEEAEVIARRIRSQCQDTQVENIPVSLSIGYACKERTGQDLQETLREAEDDMYRHKLTESQSSKSGILGALLTTLREKSEETEAHIRRVQQVSSQIAEKLGLTDPELDRLELLVRLHDIGKINIPGSVLTKEGPLTEEEWAEVKKHPEIGYRITRATEEFSHVAEDILAHHERWDGSGYPKGIKGEDIPLLARILAVADAYDVMSHGRSHEKTMSQEEIIEEFRRCSGTQFDPGIVRVFLGILEEGDH